MLSKCSEKVVAIEQDTRHCGDMYAGFMAKVATYTELLNKLHGRDRRRIISPKKGRK